MGGFSPSLSWGAYTPGVNFLLDSPSGHQGWSSVKRIGTNCPSGTMQNNGVSITYNSMNHGESTAVQCSGGANSTVQITCGAGSVQVTSGTCVVPDTYEWYAPAFAPCNTTCGRGVEMISRSVTCHLMPANTPAAESNCTGARPPSSFQCP